MVETYKKYMGKFDYYKMRGTYLTQSFEGAAERHEFEVLVNKRLLTLTFNWQSSLAKTSTEWDKDLVLSSVFLQHVHGISSDEGFTHFKIAVRNNLFIRCCNVDLYFMLRSGGEHLWLTFKDFDIYYWADSIEFVSKGCHTSCAFQDALKYGAQFDDKFDM